METPKAHTVGVILSGAGVYDGSEIHEATLTLLALAQRGVYYKIFAPDRNQMHVIDHTKGETTEETRNVLLESARIARGNIEPLSLANAHELDGVILPGGFGVAKNLCNYAEKGTDLEVIPELDQFLKTMHQLKKPMGFICIAPIMLPKIFGAGIRGTLGAKGDDARAFSKMGGDHLECCVEQCVYDETFKVLSTPAYMTAQNIAQAHLGIDRLVQQMSELFAPL